MAGFRHFVTTQMPNILLKDIYFVIYGIISDFTD